MNRFIVVLLIAHSWMPQASAGPCDSIGGLFHRVIELTPSDSPYRYTPGRYQYAPKRGAWSDVLQDFFPEVIKIDLARHEVTELQRAVQKPGTLLSDVSGDIWNHVDVVHGIKSVDGNCKIHMADQGEFGQPSCGENMPTIELVDNGQLLLIKDCVGTREQMYVPWNVTTKAKLASKRGYEIIRK